MVTHLLFGNPPGDIPPDAVQTSPLVPGASLLADMAPGSAASIHMAVPPGTIERRHGLALALRALAPGGMLLASGPKDKGGARIAKELAQFGCAVGETSRNHWRLCRATRPERLEGIDAAIAAGALRHDPALDLWTMPGIFSWDRLDGGTALLLEALAATTGGLSGHGADLGSGLGLLSRAVLADNPAVTRIDAIELDARAIEAARRNVTDPRAAFHWRDMRDPPALAGLDFAVMNPPFHSGGQDDVDLGRLFLRRAREVLRSGGVLWMVANRHLPYEAELAASFARVEPVRQNGRFKVCRATA